MVAVAAATAVADTAGFDGVVTEGPVVVAVVGAVDLGVVGAAIVAEVVVVAAGIAVAVGIAVVVAGVAVVVVTGARTEGALPTDGREITVADGTAPAPARGVTGLMASGTAADELPG